MNLLQKSILVFVVFLLFYGCSESKEPTPSLAKIVISSTNGSLLKIGETTTLTALGFDTNNQSLELTTLSWSATNDHVSVDDSGEVLAISSGFTVVKATSGSISQTFDLQVWRDGLKSIVISSSEGNLLDLNQTTQLTVEGFDELNNPVALTSLEWSVNNENVSIDQNGLVTGLAIGTSMVTANSDGVEKDLTIRVWDSTAPRTEIYVVDAGNFQSGGWQILKYDENGENGRVFINSNLGWPQDILFLEDQGVALVSNFTTGTIAKFNANTGAFVGNFATSVGTPTRLKIGKDGLLYVLQWQTNGRVQRYELDGTFVDQFSSVGVTESIGLDWDSSGRLYVSSFSGGAGGSVRKFDTSGGDLGLFVNSNVQGPTNIWFDNDGNLLVNDWQGGKVVKYDATGKFVSNFITGLNQPEGVDFLSNGDILIGDGGTSTVKQYTSNGVFVKNLVKSRAAGLKQPNGVTVRRVNF